MSTVIQSTKILFFFAKFWTMFHSTVGQPQSWSKTDYPPPWRYHICFKNCRVITQETTHTHCTNHFCIRSEDLGMRFFFLQRISVECSPVSSLSLIRDVKVSVDFSICFISLIHTVRKVFHDLDFVTQGSLQQLIGRDHDSILTEKKSQVTFYI